jgi:hypothetical protein
MASEAKPKATPTVGYLDHGAIVIRNFLSEEQQLEVLKTSEPFLSRGARILSLLNGVLNLHYCFPSIPTGFKMRDPASIHMNPNSLYTPLFTWNWPGNKMGDYQNEEKQREEPHFFDRVLGFGADAFKLVQEVRSVSLCYLLLLYGSTSCLSCPLRVALIHSRLLISFNGYMGLSSSI